MEYENDASNYDLTILPVKEDPNTKKYRPTHPNLLAPPFRIAVVGSSRSGKSNYLMNYFRSDFYGESKKKNIPRCFDKVIVFSPNMGFDKTTKALQDIAGEENIRMDYHDSYIDQIVEHQKNSAEEDRDRILIIADDLLAMGCSPTAKLFTISTYLRHLDCSIIYLTQTYQSHKSLPPVVKNNLEGVVWFRSPSAKQIKAFSEDLGGTFGSQQNVEAIIDYSCKKPYNFAFFNYRDLCAYHNHDSLLYEKYDENGGFGPEFTGSALDKTEIDSDSEV